LEARGLADPGGVGYSLLNGLVEGLLEAVERTVVASLEGRSIGFLRKGLEESVEETAEAGGIAVSGCGSNVERK